jgi:zinc/manganese transport system substrate-binding protein
MSRTTPRLVRRAALALAAATLAACTSAPEAPTAAPAASPEPAPAAADDVPEVEPVEVVVTTSILGDLVRRLVGEDGTVRVLMEAGVDPHTYAASAADAAAMRDADLVVANGLMLEEGLIGTLEAAVADGVRVLSVADGLDPIPFALDDHADDDGHDHDHDHAHEDAHEDEHWDEHAHDHGELDPHVWFDPLRMATGAELIAAALAEVRPDVAWVDRAAALRTELEALDAELTAAFATIPAERRRLVTNHDSLGYLADRYGFGLVASVIPGSSTAVETNPAAFAALADLLVAEGIDVVFAETTDSDALARQLATEVAGRGGLEVEVVTLFTGSLGPEGSGADTYVGLMRTDAERIVAALAG